MESKLKELSKAATAEGAVLLLLGVAPPAASPEKLKHPPKKIEQLKHPPKLVNPEVDGLIKQIQDKLNEMPGVKRKKPAKAELIKLIEQLGSDRYKEREKASKELASIGHSILSELEEVVKNPKKYDLETRSRAERLLVPLKNEDYIKKTSESLLESITKLGSHGKKADDAVPVLIKTLETAAWLGSIELKEASIKTLGKMGAKAEAAVPLLIEMTEDHDFHARRAAAEALGEIKPKVKAKEVVTALIKVLGDENHIVRSDAVLALEKIKPEAKEVVPELIKMLKGEKFIDIKRDITRLLGDYGPAAEAVVDTLVDNARKTKHPDFKVDIAEALGKIGSKSEKTSKLLNDLVEAAKKVTDGGYSFDNQQALIAGRYVADALKKNKKGHSK